MSEKTPELVMKYFVLKPAGDDQYAKASRVAMLKYADWIINDNPALGQQLREWASQENAEAYARSIECSPQDIGEERS